MPSIIETMIGGFAAGVGFAIGIGATAIGSEKARPLAKRAMKGYLMAVDRVKEMAAEAGETMQDLYAEAKAEHEAEMRGGA
ncbi:MAG: DUF5132 domain-containing protein [Chloroflexota bacterium]